MSEGRSTRPSTAFCCALRCAHTKQIDVSCKLNLTEMPPLFPIIPNIPMPV